MMRPPGDQKPYLLSSNPPPGDHQAKPRVFSVQLISNLHYIEDDEAYLAKYEFI